MKSTVFPAPNQAVSSTKYVRQVSVSLAKNAGASALASIAVPMNTIAIVKARVLGAAGPAALTPFSVTCDADTDLMTKVAHGLQTGTPVMVKGTAQPGGITATTVYFATVASADTLKLYDTYARAVADGGTGAGGQVNITSAGTAVVCRPMQLNAVYEILATCRNQNGTVALLGSVSQPFVVEDVSAWDATFAADNTNKAVLLNVTPDAEVATRFEAEIDVEIVSINVRA